MRKNDQHLIIRYWSGELTEQEEIRVQELLTSEADGEEASQILQDLQTQQDLLNTERANSALPFSQGSLVEQSIQQWEKESKVVYFRARWIAPLIGVAAAIVISILILNDKPTKQNPISTNSPTNLADNTKIEPAEVEGMYTINQEISELELAIVDAAKNRRFSRYNPNQESN